MRNELTRNKRRSAKQSQRGNLYFLPSPNNNSAGARISSGPSNWRTACRLSPAVMLWSASSHPPSLAYHTIPDTHKTSPILLFYVRKTISLLQTLSLRFLPCVKALLFQGFPNLLA
jgi:hypothetical protein